MFDETQPARAVGREDRPTKRWGISTVALARISHTDLGSEEQSRQLHANIVRMEGCNLRESWQAQGRCGDGRGRVWPGAVSGSSVRRSAHELCVGEGEVALIGVTRSHREGNATHAGADEGAEL